PVRGPECRNRRRPRARRSRYVPRLSDVRPIHTHFILECSRIQPRRADAFARGELEAPAASRICVAETRWIWDPYGVPASPCALSERGGVHLPGRRGPGEV